MLKLSKEDIATFFLKVPDKRRKTFSIIRRVKLASGEIKNETFTNPQVKIINDLLLAGKKTTTSARLEFKELINQLQTSEKKRRGDLITSDENYQVLTQYLESKYPERKRREIDFKSVENESARTLKILGHKSALTASQEDLQRAIDTIEPQQQKRYVSRLTSILKTIGRSDIELFYSKKRKQRVTHINRADLNVLIKSIKNETRPIAGIAPSDFADFVTTLFCTGCRIGEALALERIHFKAEKFTLKVEQQLKQNGKISETKTKKERTAVVIDFGIDALANWIKLDKEGFSRFQAAKHLSEKTKSLFTDKNKHISLHGLRHSYAIYLLRDAEISLSSVASFLGDSIKTTEDYYIDFVASDETIQNAVLKIKRTS